ncbi:MAG: tripartite tricarboxylate transporter substrate binding protein BugD [Burkholderiales bacterium]|nr:tripartite tricarboxylate transporter substrate binding protein BugD [Burkholderiales bacterium]
MKFIVRAAAVAALALAASQAGAQNYPTKPVTLVVPFAAGGPTDIVTRQLAQAMTKPMGGTVIVENKPGAGGTLAVEFVSRAAADGYTVLVHHIGMSTAPALYRTLRFNPMTDFEYIGQVVDVPMTLVANNNFPPKNYAELIPYLKANKDKVNYANAGLGAASHLCGLLFMSTIQVDLQTIPYKGTAPAMTDLQGGQVQLLCDQTTQTTQLINTGRIKAYGVTTMQKVGSLPNVATLDSQGLKGFDLAVWHGMYAPKNTPKAVTDKLNMALQAALKDPAFKDAMDKLGAIIVPPAKQTPDGLRNFLKAEIDKWTPIIKKAGQYAD